jgi:4-alpha-glucanotransferase
LDDNFWVSQINVQNGLSIKHILQFFDLWWYPRLHHLLRDNRYYSTVSAYKMQFEGLTLKCKIFCFVSAT